MLQWTMQRVRPTVTNTLDLTNMIGGYYCPITMGNLLSAHAQELESMTRHVSGITLTTLIYQILEMIFP